MIFACPVWVFELWHEVQFDSPGAPVRREGAPGISAWPTITADSPNEKAKIIIAENEAIAITFTDLILIVILIILQMLLLISDSQFS